VLARGLEVDEALAGEAVVADVGHGALDASLVPGVPHPCGIDLEAAGLGVLQEGLDQAGLQRVGRADDRLGVVRQERVEDAAEEGPGGLTGFDRAGGGLLEAGVDEAMPGADRGEDPGSEAATTAREVWRQPTGPADVELQLVAGIAVEHGDGGGPLAESELGNGEAMQRRVGDLDPVAAEQAPHLGEAQATSEPVLDSVALIEAQQPRGSALTLGRRVQRRHDRG
jgi:hypothetical protein